MSGVRPDIELLVRSAKPRLTEAEIADIKTLIRAHAAELDWGLFIDQAYLHKVLPLIAQNFLDHHLYPAVPDSRLRFRHEQLFRLIADGTSARNESLLRELAVVLRTLDRQRIPVLVRKGPVLMQDAYGDHRFRAMNDLDVMVEPQDLARAVDALEGLGYAGGKQSPLRRTVIPYTRAEALYAKLKVPNLTLLRPATDRFVDYYIVDVCLNQFLPDSGYDLPAGGFAERARPVKLFGDPALVFTPEEMIIDLTVHLFKEATTLRFIEVGRDLCLSKFLDIAEYVGSGPAIDWPLFERRCREYGVTKPVYFGLHFTDLLYPGVLPADVLDALRPPDLTYLDQFGAADKHAGTWGNTDFVARMFDRDRATEAPPSRALV